MKEFDELRKNIETLRGPGGCSWDKNLTLKGASNDVLSEAREVATAVDNKDFEDIKEEIGDLMWSTLLLVQILEDEGKFTLQDILNDANEKLVRRHPHVFTDAKAETPEEAHRMFAEAKKKEKEGKPKKTYKIPMREFVSSVFIMKDKKVLLLHHKKLGMWLPPGGHIESNELPCEAVLREAEEETGLKIKLIGSEQEKVDKVKLLVHPFAVQLEDIKENHQHIDLVYYGEVTGGKEKRNENESKNMKWFSEKEIKESNEIDEFNKKEILKAFKYFNKK